MARGKTRLAVSGASPLPLEGPKVRLRAETFADHYTHARLFYRSQTEIEQAHLASALVFELSKVVLEHVRNRIMANLRNVDEDLAAARRQGLEHGPARKVQSCRRTERHGSSLLRYASLANIPDTLQGRSVGILVTDGADGKLVKAVRKAAEGRGSDGQNRGAEDRWRHAQGWQQAEGRRPARGHAFGAIRCRSAGAVRGWLQRTARRTALPSTFAKHAFGHLKAIGFSARCPTTARQGGRQSRSGRSWSRAWRRRVY